MKTISKTLIFAMTALSIAAFAQGCGSDKPAPSTPGDQETPTPTGPSTTGEAGPPPTPSGILDTATAVVKREAPGGDVAERLLIDPDGRLYTIGIEGEAPPTIRITRFMPNGEVDAGFGTGGAWIGDHGLTFSLDTLAVAWKDGKILFGMTKSSGGEGGPVDLLVFLHKLDGTLDSAFGTSGVSLQDFDDCANSVYDLELRSDGGFLALGDTCQIEPDGTKRERRDVLAALFNTAGMPDLVFGKKGFIAPTDDTPADLVVFSGDSFAVIAGRHISDTHNEIAVARFLADGTPDAAFDDDGVYASDLGLGSVFPSKAVADAGGNLLVAGSYYLNDADQGAFVLRLNPQGRPDPGFGNAGVFKFDRDHVNQSVWGLVVETGGKILVGGTLNDYKTAPWKEIFVLRLNPNGALDTDYGEAGLFHSNFGEEIAGLNDIKLAPDGSLVLLGYARPTPVKMILVRLTK